MERAAGATYVRIIVSWSSIAPATLPDGFVASDPTSPGYSWAALDAVVEDAASAGLTPILDLTDTPSGRMQDSPPGSQRRNAEGRGAS